MAGASIAISVYGAVCLRGWSGCVSTIPGVGNIAELTPSALAYSAGKQSPSGGRSLCRRFPSCVPDHVPDDRHRFTSPPCCSRTTACERHEGISTCWHDHCTVSPDIIRRDAMLNNAATTAADDKSIAEKNAHRRLGGCRADERDRAAPPAAHSRRSVLVDAHKKT